MIASIPTIATRKEPDTMAMTLAGHHLPHVTARPHTASGDSKPVNRAVLVAGITSWSLVGLRVVLAVTG
jgi:hypothetical protein